MIKIDYTDFDGKIAFVASGHSESRTCAAVSFMLQSLVQCLLDNCIDVSYQLNEGDITISIPVKSVSRSNRAWFYTIFFIRDSLENLAKQKPEELTMIINDSGGSK